MSDDVQKKALEVLHKVDDRLSTEDKWTQHAYARDYKGLNVHTSSPDAEKFCLSGAVKVECRHLDDFDLQSLVHLTLHEALPTPHPFIQQFNDVSAFQDVKALLKRAIAKLDSQP